MACEALTSALVALRQKEVLSGDELLPLAPRIDALAVALGDLQRIDEQRAAPPRTSGPHHWPAAALQRQARRGMKPARAAGGLMCTGTATRWVSWRA